MKRSRCLLFQSLLTLEAFGVLAGEMPGAAPAPTAGAGGGGRPGGRGAGRGGGAGGAGRGTPASIPGQYVPTNTGNPVELEDDLVAKHRPSNVSDFSGSFTLPGSPPAKTSRPPPVVGIQLSEGNRNKCFVGGYLEGCGVWFSY